MNLVPTMLLVIAMVLTTMAVSALSPILNVVVAAAILWYAWNVPAVKNYAAKFVSDFKLA
jgi:hypothetical protein